MSMMTFLKKTLLTLAFLTGSVIAFANDSINPPTQDNAAYVLMEYDTGTILAQSNANTPLPPASLTKMPALR